MNQVDPSVFAAIDGDAMFNAALRSQGGAGPSGLDAHGLSRMLCSKNFRTEGNDLCNALAEIARKLCTTLINPAALEPLLIGKLIALDKNPGIRPIVMI